MPHTFNALDMRNSIPTDDLQEPHQRLRLPPQRLHVHAEAVQIVLEAYKLADSDTENVRDLNAKECLNDGLKSNYNENVCVQKGEGSTATW